MPGDAWRCRKMPGDAGRARMLRLGKAKASLRSRLWIYGQDQRPSEFGFSDFGLWSKTEGLTQTGPNLDRDRSGPFSGTDGLGSVRSTDLRSVFGLS